MLRQQLAALYRARARGLPKGTIVEHEGKRVDGGTPVAHLKERGRIIGGQADTEKK